MTVTIQIGNSDNKLTQIQWSGFVDACHGAIACAVANCGGGVHFAGAPASNAPWQNFCWVIEINAAEMLILENSLLMIRGQFGQESVAVTRGNTRFI